MKNYIDLGFTKVYFYSIMILIGMMLGIYLVYREFKRHHYDLKNLDNMAFYTVLYGLIGARIWYVIFNLSEYKDNLWEVLAIWHGGLAIHGAIFGGLLFLFFYSRKHKLSFIKIADIVMPAVLIGQIIGRWGNFFNQEAHGGIVSLSFLEKLHLPQFIIDGMNINGVYYHPTFLYESVFNLFILIFILILRRRKKVKEGNILSVYLIGYGILRFFVESLRTDSLMLGNIRVAQLISIIFFIIGIVLLIISIKKFDYYNKEEKETKEIKEEVKKEIKPKKVNETIGKKTTKKNSKKKVK